MKKHYLSLLFMLFAAVSFGQVTDLYFSMYAEGSSNTKFVEIYNGTSADVDLSNYMLRGSNNGNDWKNSRDLALTGTLSAGAVYVISTDQSAQAVLDKADLKLPYESPVHYNGDDAIGLFKNDGSGTYNLIDVVGVPTEDPGYGWEVAGVTNATKDHTLTRKTTVCGPNNDWAASAGTDASNSEWVVTAIDSEWANIGSYTGCVSNPDPILNIAKPNNNWVFSPETTDVSLEFNIQNFTLSGPSASGADGTGDGYIKATLKETTQNITSVEKIFSTNPLNIEVAAGENFTITLELVDNNGTSLSPAVTATTTFNVASYTQVANLTALKSVAQNEYYEVTGDVVVSYNNLSNRNQRYIQDDMAGMLIDDAAGTITNTYDVGAVISGGIKGRLTNYRGVLQFVPAVNPAASTSTEPVKITEVSLEDYVTDATGSKRFQSMLVTITNATFTGADGSASFDTNTTKSYEITQGASKMEMRINFNATDFNGSVIPSGVQKITGIAGEFTNGGTTKPQVYPTKLTDIQALSTEKNEIKGFAVYPNPVTGTSLTISSASAQVKNVRIFNVLGKQVLTQKVNGNNATINTTKFNAGIYILKVEENNKISTKKLVIK